MEKRWVIRLDFIFLSVLLHGWEKCAKARLSYCLVEVHWQLHLIDSFIIASLMMTFPILSVQLLPSLLFQLLIIPPRSALIWWGSQQSYCFPHSQLLLSTLPLPASRPTGQLPWLRLNGEQQMISTEEGNWHFWHISRRLWLTDDETHRGHQQAHT